MELRQRGDATNGTQSSTLSARQLLESIVIERATHDTPDKVGDTRSFANMERTLTREYWGRFLIELLQNARDAWLASMAGGRDGIVRIRLTKDPALVVCNEGEPLTSEVVLQSISKFGESPKAYGTAIGHKGIGFKAVLELTRAPRLYSRRDANGPFELKVRFDPDEARRLVKRWSPNWDHMVAELLSVGLEDGMADRIPVLRFPLWDESPPDWLDDMAEFDGHKFNTIVALPYDPRYETQLALTSNDFVERVRRAIGELSDEVTLLLEVFARIVIEDEIAGEVHEIVRWETRLPESPEGILGSDVTITRDDVPNSRWWLFEETLPGYTGLEGDIAVGVRVAQAAETLAPVGLLDDRHDESAADSFHVFFPTRIRTHLPYLFHAYFEVDAGRKGFAEDKESANRARMEGLQDLAVKATHYLASRAAAEQLNLIALPSRFAECAGEPDDKLAREFRNQLLGRLDREPWVVVQGSTIASFAAPADLLIDARPPLPELLPIAFPASYLLHRLGRSYAASSEPSGLKFLAARNAISSGRHEGLDAASLSELLHPDKEGIWTDDADNGFRALLEVLDRTKRDAEVQRLLDELRSDATATFIPVVEEAGRRRLRSPGQRRSVAGAEENDEVGGILARVSPSSDAALVPPPSLGLDFLADGVVDAELLSGIGPRLGIRPYQTESILDALAASSAPGTADDLLVFAWRLLLRERVSAYSVANAVRDSATFQPGHWFWSRPGSNRTDASRDIRRARALAHLRIPTKAGNWRPAGELAFGVEWADWQAESKHGIGSTAVDRADAYRDLETAAPDREALVAAPSVLANLLPLDPNDVRWSESDAGPELPADKQERHRVLLHAFLLRLGVWEIPPILGHVEYRYPSRDSKPAWQTPQDWSKYWALVAKMDADFTRFKHKNVYVAEDYRLSWPIGSDSAFIRALSRGASFYRGYWRAELFCPQCSSGTWHTKRYSSDGDPRIPSTLRLQLLNQPWVPTTIGNSPPTATLPRDAWQEDDRPDEIRMQQSWLRFVPLVVHEVSEELAALVGVVPLRDAGAPRIVRLLKALRSQFDSGVIVPDRRATSFESQALAGVHWRLYQQLVKREAGTANSSLKEIGILATLGRSLVYQPAEEVRHDDGMFSAYKRYFLGQIPFSILQRDLGAVADALGIPRFRLTVERLSGGHETNVTDNVRSVIHDRAAEFLALQVFHPLGTQALHLDSHAFTIRTEKLRRLEVIQVDDLVLRVQVLGMDVTKDVGAGRGEDMFLDDRSNPPVLYHDLKGTRWEERFRVLAGPHVATLLENPAYAAYFQLLLQQETPAELEAFLDDQSISEEDLDVVRQHMELVSGMLRAEERRWWSVLLPLLGAKASSRSDAETYRRETREVLEVAAEVRKMPGLVHLLLRAGGGELVRKDTSSDGVLATLEALGFDLVTLHRRLQDAGDRGITVDVAARLLADWRHVHGREVSAILANRSEDLEIARTRPEAWRIENALAFRIRVSPGEYLAPVLADLHEVGLVAEATRMVGAGASAYLASLIGETPEGLAAAWRGLFDEEERARLDHDHALAWRQVLRPVLVAARTHAGDTPSVIRNEAEEVDRLLGTSSGNAAALADRLHGVLVDAVELVEALAVLVLADRSLAVPAADQVREVALAFIDPDHLDRVSSVLRRGQRIFVDQLRREMEKVKEAKLVARPFEGSRPPPSPVPRTAGTRLHIGHRRPHDQRVRDRLGVQGERAALATVLDAILVQPAAEQNGIIAELIDLLLEVAEEGEIVSWLVAEGRAAMAAFDEDDRLESLARLLWVGDKSDDFGFDLLGFLAPYAAGPPSRLLLEVKNSADRSFIVTAPEWRRAEEQGERYAFLVVLRSEADAPAAMELIPNPAERLELRQLSRREESWRVSYQPIPPS